VVVAKGCAIRSGMGARVVGSDVAAAGDCR